MGRSGSMEHIPCLHGGAVSADFPAAINARGPRASHEAAPSLLSLRGRPPSRHTAVASTQIRWHWVRYRPVTLSHVRQRQACMASRTLNSACARKARGDSLPLAVGNSQVSVQRSGVWQHRHLQQSAAVPGVPATMSFFPVAFSVKSPHLRSLACTPARVAVSV